MVSPVMPPRVDRGVRRIVLCGLTTVSAVVLLFSYRTSTAPELSEAAGTPADAADAATVGAASPDAAPPDTAPPGVAPPYAAPPDTAPPDTASSGAASPDAGATAAVPSRRAGPAGRGYSGTVTGPVVQVKWGQVQVRATLEAGRITAVDVLRTPNENAHDRQVNAAAVPVLVRETLAAQSTRIDMVSGATFTSGGYVRSLQAALDRAGTA